MGSELLNYRRAKNFSKVTVAAYLVAEKLQKCRENKARRAVGVSTAWHFGRVTVAESWGRFFAIGAHSERKNPARKIFASGN